MYLCVRGCDVGRVLCERGIYVGHAIVCEWHRCWLCIFVLGVQMLVMYLCVNGIDVGHVFVC
jgi:hypothetical protein